MATRIPLATIRQLSQQLADEYAGDGPAYQAAHAYAIAKEHGSLEERVEATTELAEASISFVFEWLVRNGIVILTDPLPNSAVVQDASLTGGFLEGFNEAHSTVPDVAGRDLPRGSSDG